MTFTFGIISDYRAPERLQEMYTSIRALGIPPTAYEILVIGNAILPDEQDVRHIPFDETQKPMWVTRKKNILDQEARFENLVVAHDYYVFHPAWYSNYLMFGNDWEVCSNAQHLMDGSRHFSDWVTWDSPFYPRYTSLPYDDWSHTKYMYQSGGYMVVKKGVLSKFPMNETKGWGTAEDVEWSLIIRSRLVWKCNGRSVVRHNKAHRDLGRQGFPFKQLIHNRTEYAQ
jgi:hypothetical protein